MDPCTKVIYSLPEACIATCSVLGEKEYALKMAAVSKTKKKNQAAFMISHERIIYRVRLNAFRKDIDGTCDESIHKQKSLISLGARREWRISFQERQRTEKSPTSPWNCSL